jgi:hypothetical protein
MRKGIVDAGFERIASKVMAQQEAPGGVDLYKAIQDLRQAVDDAGLYYYPPAAADALTRLDLPEGDSDDQYVMLEGTDKWGTDHRSMSNMEAILSELRGKASSDLVRADGGEYAVRVLNPDGSMTAGGQVLEGIFQALSDYPVLDDEDLSRREYEDAVESISSNGSRYVSDEAPEDWPEKVFSWLWENDQRALETETDGSIYVPEKSIQAALEDLGFAYEEDDDEDEFPDEPDPLAEGFATGPNPVDPRQTDLPFKGGRRRAQQQGSSWKEALMEELGRSPKKRSQAVPPLPVEDEEELNPEDMEDMSTSPAQPGREKFNWNDYIWGPFRKEKPARRYVSQMSLQDDAIVRMVEQEDARLVKYRGGFALVPLDGYAYTVDDAGAELALAHGAEDWTQPKERMKTGGREVLVTTYKGVSDQGLERIARRFQAQSGGPTGNEIVDSMARTLFVDAWARDWEYLFEDYEDEDLQEAASAAGTYVPSFAGAELMDIAPDTSPEAYVSAQKIYDAIQQANPGVDLETFVPPGEDPDSFDREDFGHYLAMQAMGSGVRWSDSHTDHGLKIPYIENDVMSDEVGLVKDALDSAAAAAEEDDLLMTTKERDEE